MQVIFNKDFLQLELYINFGLYRFPVYSGLNLDSFHCTVLKTNMTPTVCAVVHYIRTGFIS